MNIYVPDFLTTKKVWNISIWIFTITLCKYTRDVISYKHVYFIIVYFIIVPRRKKYLSGPLGPSVIRKLIWVCCMRLKFVKLIDSLNMHEAPSMFKRLCRVSQILLFTCSWKNSSNELFLCLQVGKFLWKGCQTLNITK